MNDSSLSRREILAAGTVALAAASAFAQIAPTPTLSAGPKATFDARAFGWDEAKGEYTLPPLPYDAKALEPHIDAETMTIHSTKHHAAYVAGLNKALAELKRIRENQGDLSAIKHWSRELAFHGAGHVNHCLFWQMMAPADKGGGGSPTGGLLKAIERDFGGFEKLVGHFKAAAGQVEGGGWAWLMADPISGRLVVHQSEKQQEQYIPGWRPILGIDVWEHAYYLKYQNRRSDYVNAFMSVANWGFAARLFEAVKA
jgi:Fe-Mn family superoxide dismutase